MAILNRSLLIWFLIGKARPFSDLSPDDRERVLQALGVSRLGKLRAGFQVVKRLACFLFYSIRDAQGLNPTWPLIGYTPTTNALAASALLSLTAIEKSTTLDCDVCVVGSGTGGSVVAAELAASGKNVLILEAGSGKQSPDFDQHEKTGMDSLYLDHGLMASQDLGVAIVAGATLGGGTAINWQTSLDTPEAVRDEWASVSGCRHFAEESFSRSLEAVVHRLHANTRESVVNRNNEMLQKGCNALGYRWSTLRRNAKGCDPAQCGYCVYGCRHGGKQSTAVTFLADAQRWEMPKLWSIAG